MKLNQHLKDWKQIVSSKFPNLSLPQLSGLATWSFGMVMTQSSSLTKVATLIAKVNQEPENTVRQRLKEWYKSGSAKAKKGNKRASIEVIECFGSLLQWVVDLLPQTTKELPIAKVTCFKTNPIKCTLLARWDDGYADPWLILTNLKSTDTDITWYGFRSWIECSYRDVKSDGWQWHKTRLREPDRAERHWLAMALAMLWMVTLGGEQEISSDEQLIDARPLARKSTPTRQISCFLNGLLTVVAQLLKGQPITLGRLFPLSFIHFQDLHFANSS